ncbi:dihydrofolate reductase [Sphingobacterium sp. SGG-5]|uniref:NAD(P)-dependent oxidoreductase n=1 Tax=Sphingobacterium sp. SGG-5 TaxID=2710881 RepID=UPI0013EE25A8|nr:NAD(P)-dependent oxidoreductase [Sphingobacterium sp. SGG-5]NGM61024.1 dihydrofolate reductase [Sphingobacterium sp. SGG-5]
MLFKKLVAVEPLNLIPSAEKALFDYAAEVVMYDDMPATVEEMVARIGDADAVLISYTSRLEKDALEQCPHVKYIGMCCSLYTPESANVDILYAQSRGMTVLGVRDYGDEGVVEYVVSELVRCLHGFGTKKDGSPREPWDGVPREITGIKAGIVGLGKSGGMVADALKFFGADISYFARSEKEEAKQKGYRFLPLQQLLKESEVIVTCLNKNTVLLHAEEFAAMGDRKILFNTGLSPAWDEEPFAEWINGDNVCYCDTLIALGNEKFLTHPHVHCMGVSVGRTRQAFDRLSEKVLANIETFLKRQ